MVTYTYHNKFPILDSYGSEVILLYESIARPLLQYNRTVQKFNPSVVIHLN